MRGRYIALGGFVAVALTVLAAGLGCARPPRTRVVILGLDGLEYNALHRYAKDLPNLTKLLAEGAHAEMEVTTPIMSPILSVAHFVKLEPLFEWDPRFPLTIKTKL